jgi:hypothetical protein
MLTLPERAVDQEPKVRPPRCGAPTGGLNQKGPTDRRKNCTDSRPLASCCLARSVHAGKRGVRTYSPRTRHCDDCLAARLTVPDRVSIRVNRERTQRFFCQSYQGNDFLLTLKSQHGSGTRERSNRVKEKPRRSGANVLSVGAGDARHAAKCSFLSLPQPRLDL